MSCVGLLVWACPAHRPVAVLPPPAPPVPAAAPTALEPDYSAIRHAEEQIEQVDVTALIESQRAATYAAEAAEAAQPSMVGRLTARLVDEADAAAGAIALVLRDANGREWRTRSGADGLAHFADLPLGDYRLELQEGGIEPIEVHVDGRTEIELRVPGPSRSRPRAARQPVNA